MNLEGELRKQTPGPGQYKPKYNMSLKGEYFLSNFKSSLCRTFTQSQRSEMKGRGGNINNFDNIISDTPGPGQYRIPSDFGHYENQQKYKEESYRTEKKRVRSLAPTDRKNITHSSLSRGLLNIKQTDIL